MKDSFKTMIATEDVLNKDWDNSKENSKWDYLKKEDSKMIEVTVNPKHVNTIHPEHGKLRAGQVYCVPKDWDFNKNDLFDKVKKEKKKVR